MCVLLGRGAAPTRIVGPRSRSVRGSALDRRRSQAWKKYTWRRFTRLLDDTRREIAAAPVAGPPLPVTPSPPLAAPPPPLAAPPPRRGVPQVVTPLAAALRQGHAAPPSTPDATPSNLGLDKSDSEDDVPLAELMRRTAETAGVARGPNAADCALDETSGDEPEDVPIAEPTRRAPGDESDSEDEVPIAELMRRAPGADDDGSESGGGDGDGGDDDDDSESDEEDAPPRKRPRTAAAQPRAAWATKYYGEAAAQKRSRDCGVDASPRRRLSCSEQVRSELSRSRRTEPIHWKIRHRRGSRPRV